MVTKRNGMVVFAVAAAFGLANTAARAEAETVVMWGQCEVAVSVETLAVSDEPVAVQASYTEAIGDEIVAAFPEESRIRVVSVGRDDEDEPQTVRLTLDTSNAAPGTWGVTLRGSAGECVGSVVVAGGPDGR